MEAKKVWSFQYILVRLVLYSAIKTITTPTPIWNISLSLVEYYHVIKIFSNFLQIAKAAIAVTNHSSTAELSSILAWRITLINLVHLSIDKFLLNPTVISKTATRLFATMICLQNMGSAIYYRMVILVLFSTIKLPLLLWTISAIYIMIKKLYVYLYCRNLSKRKERF